MAQIENKEKISRFEELDALSGGLYACTSIFFIMIFFHDLFFSSVFDHQEGNSGARRSIGNQ